MTVHLHPQTVALRPHLHQAAVPHFGSSPTPEKPGIKTTARGLVLTALAGLAASGMAQVMSKEPPTQPQAVAKKQTSATQTPEAWVKKQLEGRSPEEIAEVLDWMKLLELNQYGDPKGTNYAGGTPLFNESTGKTMKLYTYLTQQHPNKIWTQFAWVQDSMPERGKEEQLHVIRWMDRYNLNNYGDPKGTSYAGGNPLYNEQTGTFTPLSLYLIDRLWETGYISSSTIPWRMEGFVYDQLPRHSHQEREQIIGWMHKNELNRYGDPLKTDYDEYDPLFDENNGKFTALYDHLVAKYPQKPWFKTD